MYMRRMVEVGKATNGYVVECRVPIKKDEKNKKAAANMVCEYEGSKEMQFIAKDEKEVVAILGKLLPMLDDSFTSEEQFNAAFEKAADV